MELIEQLAEAALQRDSLRLRSLVQDITRANINWSMISRPKTTDLRLLALSASLAELLASRQKQIERVGLHRAQILRTEDVGTYRDRSFHRGASEEPDGVSAATESGHAQPEEGARRGHE